MGKQTVLYFEAKQSISLKTMEKPLCVWVCCTFLNFVKQCKNSHWLQRESIAQEIPQGFGRMASAE